MLISLQMKCVYKGVCIRKLFCFISNVTHGYFFILISSLYMQVVCAYASFEEEDIVKFGFDIFDEDGSGSIDEYEMRRMVSNNYAI